MSYDDLYGMDLDTYCKRHHVTVEKLINKTQIDIEILSERLNSLKEDISSPEFNYVYKVLDKKRKHLHRLQEWRNYTWEEAKALETQQHTEDGMMKQLKNLVGSVQSVLIRRSCKSTT